MAKTTARFAPGNRAFQLTMPDALIDQVRQIAGPQQRSIAATIRLAVVEYLERQEKKAP
jgi:predicted transcriptional regulator